MTTAMRPEDFCGILNYLELSDASAAVAFGMAEVELHAMKDGRRPVPFLVSALAVLMCESPKATQLAIEHGLWMKTAQPSLSDLIANATGAGIVLRSKPKPDLRIVKNEP